MPSLFVYGTLRDEPTQRRVFGRALEGRLGALDGFRRGAVAATAPAAADRTGRPQCFNLLRDGEARVEGTVLEVRHDELAAVDAYERADGFVRVAVTLASGEPAWTYVHHASSPGARHAGALLSLVDRAVPPLLAFPEARSVRRPAAGAWCPREIVGHLVDSATVNLQRFVRARSQGDLVFDGYDQDAWVAAQGYVDAPWRDLVRLWRLLNLQVARVMDATPEDVCTRVHTRHTLDRIAFRTVRPDEPVTLEVLMEDYVAHLLHHLRQVLGAGWPGRPA